MGQKDCLVGDDAQSKRGWLTLKFPIVRGLVTDWDDMEKIWHQTFYELRVAPEECSVLMAEPLLNPKASRERMCKICFETFECLALSVVAQAVLALASAGRSTGVVLDSGEGLTRAVPVYAGNTLAHAVLTVDLGGGDLTHYMEQLMGERGYGSGVYDRSHTDMLREIKEKLCFVAVDFEASNGKDSDLPAYSGGRWELPDGSVWSCGTACFRCPEALFHPEQCPVRPLSEADLQRLARPLALAQRLLAFALAIRTQEGFAG